METRTGCMCVCVTGVCVSHDAVLITALKRVCVCVCVCVCVEMGDRRRVRTIESDVGDLTES
jgi:hypothetical protein